MIGNASALFRATFGVAPRVVASAPGRVNLLGEHTDYNGGPGLPVATAARTSGAGAPGGAGGVRPILPRAGERARVAWGHRRPPRRGRAPRRRVRRGVGTG